MVHSASKPPSGGRGPVSVNQKRAVFEHRTSNRRRSRGDAERRAIDDELAELDDLEDDDAHEGD